jgi:hypothetical protein
VIDLWTLLSNIRALTVVVRDGFSDFSAPQTAHENATYPKLLSGHCWFGAEGRGVI